MPDFEGAERLTEVLLEEHRPASSVPRGLAVFMIGVEGAPRREQIADLIDKAGGYSDRIYEVGPLGAVERGDLRAWAEMFAVAEDVSFGGKMPSRRKIAEIARRYWTPRAGVPPSKLEYRAARAMILGEVR